MRTIKTISQTLRGRIGPIPPDEGLDERRGLGVLGAGNISGGMVTEVDPADLEDNQLTIAKNVAISNDRVKRRLGLTEFSLAKPNSSEVSAIAEYSTLDSTKYLLRHTKSSIHYATSSAWTALTGTLTTPSERHRIVVIGNQYFFTNGVDKIQEVDFGAGTFGNLGNASSFRFLASFADRLIAAWETGVSENPVMLAYSGNKNYDEWSSLVDLSAGNVPLTQSDSGQSDFITGGIFTLGDYLIIIRDRSILLASRNPSATSPLTIHNALTGYGSIFPDAIGKAGDSLIIPDYRAENIFVYTVPNSLTPIADNVKSQIFTSISDPTDVFGVYFPRKAEYLLAIPAVDYVKVWKFNFRTKAWSYDEYESLSALYAIDSSSFSLAFDELTGTFDELPGTFDDLGSTSKQPPKLFFGFSTGELANPTEALQDFNQTFEHEIASKTFHDGISDLNIQSSRFDIVPTSTGSISLYYSRDAGVNYQLIRSFSITSNDLNKPLLIKRQRNYVAGRINWKLVSSDCRYELIEYKLIKSIGGESV